MVDQEKRDAVKKIGTVGALLLGGAGGKVYWWDRRDDHINPDKLERSIEDRAAERARGGGGWDASSTDLTRAEATVEPRGTTRKGGDRYDAILEVPLREDAAVCGRAGEPAVLASSLEQDANDAFAAVYNAAHEYAVTDQEPFEDGIEAYELRFTGEGGTGTVRFTSQQAVDIGGDALLFDPYQPEGTTDEAYQAFVETYYDVFDVECDA